MGRSIAVTQTDDLVVLLDEQGFATGTAERQSVHTGETPLHLAISCYVFDSADQLLITKRARGKTFAGVWTNSFCGHPRPGESLQQAVHRRARDELGLQLADVRLLLPEFRYTAEQHGIVENEMCPVFSARTLGGVVVDRTEVAAHEWVDWAMFSADVCDGHREVSQWSRQQIEQLRALGDLTAWRPADESRLPPAARRHAGDD